MALVVVLLATPAGEIKQSLRQSLIGTDAEAMLCFTYRRV